MAEREYRQISDLPPGITPITGAELVELEQDGVSRKFSMVALSGVVAEHEDKHQFGGEDPVGTHDLVANAIPYLGADGTIDSRVSDASTTVKGKVLLAEDGGTTPGTVVQVTDGRMTDARAPTEHASTHQPDSTDPIPLATTSAPGLMGNGDKTKLDGIDTSLLLTTAQKGALAGTYGTPGGDNRFVTDTDPRIGGEGPDITDLVNWAAFTDVPWVEKVSGISTLPGGIRYIIEWDNHVFLLPLSGRLSWWDGSTVNEVAGQSADESWKGATILDGRLYVVRSSRVYEVTINLGVYELVDYGSLLDITAIGTDGTYLYVARKNGSIVIVTRFEHGYTNGTVLTHGITETITALIACSGVFYAFTYGSPGSIFSYDPVTETFSSLSLVKAWLGAFVQNNVLYGLTLSDDIYEIDPVTPAMTAKNMTARNRYSGCVTASGDVLVVASLEGVNVVFELETVTTPSINISLSDVKVNLPASLPIGSRKVIRKLGSDATKYITITPPAGCTIEGLSEYRLYEQYASVTIERISETAFVTVGYDGGDLNVTGNLAVTGNSYFPEIQWDGKILGANQNLNTYLTGGMYRQQADANASIALNYPVALAGVLMVLPSAIGFACAGVTQVYYQYGYPGAMWRRWGNGVGTWSPWYQMIDSSNISNYSAPYYTAILPYTSLTYSGGIYIYTLPTIAVGAYTKIFVKILNTYYSSIQVNLRFPSGTVHNAVNIKMGQNTGEGKKLELTSPISGGKDLFETVGYALLTGSTLYIVGEYVRTA